MKVPGMLFYCKLCSDGRIYSGGWTLKEVVPNPLPDGYLAFEEFPEDQTDGGSHYVWNGETLVYNPVEKPSTESDSDGQEVASE